MDTILFLHSKGAQTRRKLVQLLYHETKNNYLHTITTLSSELGISKVAVKKHVDYLTYLGYVDKMNPKGKPVFLRLTEKGTIIAKKYLLF
jgi:predicted ArsR family transcriptional regulator